MEALRSKWHTKCYKHNYNTFVLFVHLSGQGAKVEYGVCVVKEIMESTQGDLAQYVTTQMLETWQQLENFRKRYDKSAEDLQKMKINHEKTLHKLQGVYHELNEVFHSSLSASTIF